MKWDWIGLDNYLFVLSVKDVRKQAAITFSQNSRLQSAAFTQTYVQNPKIPIKKQGKAKNPYVREAGNDKCFKFFS